MTIEVFKDEWKQFFDRLSCEFQHWQTSIEVVSRKFGRQSLVNKCPFVGITLETRQNGQNLIELMVGNRHSHQTHTVRDPLKVSYLQSEKLPGRLIAIEDASGDTTFINLQKPLPAQFSFGERQTISVSYRKDKEAKQ